MPKIKMPKALKHEKTFTLADATERFITDGIANGLSEKSIATRRSHLHVITQYLDAEMPLSELERSHLNKMVAEMRKNGLAKNSISSYVRVLTTFLHWCDREGLCHITPPTFKQVETVKETYSDEELLALLRRPSDNCRFTVYRNWVIINFLLNSGCRSASLRGIQNRDVFLENRQVILRHNKSGKVQLLPLCQRMRDILQEYQSIRGGEPDDYLFCNEAGEQLSHTALSKGIARYNRSRGVKKTSCHLFRHTFARKYLMDCGGNAFTLQALLGHSTLKMTQHYCKIFDADLARNFDAFSPLAQITQPKPRIHNTK